MFEEKQVSVKYASEEVHVQPYGGELWVELKSIRPRGWANQQANKQGKTIPEGTIGTNKLDHLRNSQIVRDARRPS